MCIVALPTGLWARCSRCTVRTLAAFAVHTRAMPAPGAGTVIGVAVLFALACTSYAQQQQTSLLVSPGPGVSALYMQPVVYNHTMEGCVGGGSSFWSVAQWNNPQQLGTNATMGEQGPCSRYAMVPSCVVVWGSGRVCVRPHVTHSRHGSSCAPGRT